MSPRRRRNSNKSNNFAVASAKFIPVSLFISFLRRVSLISNSGKNKKKEKKSTAASGGVAGSLDLERRVEMGYDTLAQLLTQHWNNDGGKHTRNTHTHSSSSSFLYYFTFYSLSTKQERDRGMRFSIWPSLDFRVFYSICFSLRSVSLCGSTRFSFLFFLLELRVCECGTQTVQQTQQAIDYSPRE